MYEAFKFKDITFTLRAVSCLRDNFDCRYSGKYRIPDVQICRRHVCVCFEGNTNVHVLHRSQHFRFIWQLAFLRGVVKKKHRFRKDFRIREQNRVSF